MKRTIITAVLVSFIVSAVTISSWYFFENPSKTVNIEHIDAPDHHALFAKNSENEYIPLDFTEISEKVVDAVVHIRTSKRIQGYHSGNSPRYRQLPDPFRHFFDDSDPFFRFFEPDRFQFEHKGEKGSRPPLVTGSGSGVIINSNGYIVTNNHVVDGAEDIEVILHDNRSFRATVIGTDPATDLALIQIKSNDLPTLPLVNSDDVKVGEWVLAVGNPFSLTSTVTAGIVSAKGRNINILHEKFAVESFIQTDAAINPGNSGGALVNLEGGLIGVNTAIASPTGSYSGYGFAIPANIVSKVVEDFLAYGKVQRGVLGVMIRSVDGQLQKDNDLEVAEGVYVDSLLANSAAGSAGIEPGDVIVRIEGEQMLTASNLQEKIAEHRPGDEIEVVCIRDGKELYFNVVLNDPYGPSDVALSEENVLLRNLGLELEDLDDDELQELGLNTGVKVKDIHAGIVARNTRIKPGFVITHIDGKEVKSKDEFISVIKRKNGGVMLTGVYEDIPGTYHYAFGMPENL